MNTELIFQGFGYAIAMVALMAGSFWWGYETRTRLAEKLEYFRVTNRAWREYEEELRASRNMRVPLRAELHDIGERRQSDR